MKRNMFVKREEEEIMYVRKSWWDLNFVCAKVFCCNGQDVIKRGAVIAERIDALCTVEEEKNGCD